MPLDCRVDRGSLRDTLDLPTLTRERLYWSAPGERRAHIPELVRSLTKGQWAMLVLETVQGQVDNGGFMQLFDNSGEYLSEVVDAGRLVGAERYLAVLERAIRLWPDGLPPDMVERRAYLDRCMDDEDRADYLGQALSELDEDFYALGSEGLDLLDHALRYADRDPEDFFLSPDEARQDVDDFIARLRSYAGPLPVASREALASVEAEVGRELPELVRRLYLEVGDGGWGPERGVLALAGGDGVLDRLARQKWPDATLPFCICTAGTVCVDLDVATLEPALIPIDDDGQVLRYVTASLRGWLEHWLRVPDGACVEPVTR